MRFTIPNIIPKDVVPEEYAETVTPVDGKPDFVEGYLPDSQVLVVYDGGIVPTDSERISSLTLSDDESEVFVDVDLSANEEKFAGIWKATTGNPDNQESDLLWLFLSEDSPTELIDGLADEAFADAAKQGLAAGLDWSGDEVKWYASTMAALSAGENPFGSESEREEWQQWCAEYKLPSGPSS